MKATILLATFTAIGAAQNSLLTTLPSCAVNCYVQNLPSTPCLPTDTYCLCSDAPFVANVTGCITQGCSIRDTLTAKNATEYSCRVPIEDHSKTIKVLAPTMTVLALTFLIIRFVARWSMLGWDDTCIALSWLTGTIVSALNTTMAFHGLGRHIWNVAIDDISYMLFLFYISEPLYLAATILTKIGMCLFFLRIFSFHRFKWTMYILIGINGITFFGFTTALICQCFPIEYSWLFYLGEIKGTCIDRNAGTWAHAIVNILLDVVILAVPLIQIWTLETTYSVRKKFQVMLMFSVGVIVTICSILRLKSLVTFMSGHDPTFDNLATAEWSIVEIHVGIVCSCLPSARIFFGRIIPKLLGVTTNDSRVSAAPAYVFGGPSARQRAPTWQITSSGSIRHSRMEVGEIKTTREFVRLEETPVTCASSHTDVSSLAPIKEEHHFGGR